MIAVNIGGNLFRLGGIQCKPDLALEFGKEAFGGPSVLEKEILQASLVATLPQNLAGAENLRNAAGDIEHLFLPNESIQPDGQMRLGESPPATRTLKPTSLTPLRMRVVAVNATSLISG